MTRLTDALQEFAQWLKDEQKAAATLQNYLWACRKFARWLGPNAMVADVTALALRRFLEEYRAGKLSEDKRERRPRSARGVRSGLRAFGGWLAAQAYCLENPAAGLKVIPLDAARRAVPTDAQCADILAACDRIPRAYDAALTRAILACLIYGGLRRSELLALYLADVDIAARCLHIRHGKGDQPRTQYLCKEAVDALRAYLRLRPSPCEHPYLFTRTARTSVGDRMLRTLLRSVASIAGYRDDPALLPHGLRHAFATRIYRRAGEVRAAGVMLGHSSERATEMYLHDTIEDKRRLAELAALEAPPPRQDKAAPPSEAERRRFRVKRLR